MANIPATGATRAQMGQYADLIDRYADQIGVPRQVAYNLFWRETGDHKVPGQLNPNDVSSAGAVGLAQLLPSTAALYGFTGNLRDPEQSIRVGLQYLADIAHQRGHGKPQGGTTTTEPNWAFGLGGYNVGPTGMLNFVTGRTQNLPTETRDYLLYTLRGTGLEHQLPDRYLNLYGWWNTPAERYGQQQVDEGGFADPGSVALTPEKRAELEANVLPHQPWLNWGDAGKVNASVGAQAQLLGLMPLNLDYNYNSQIWERSGAAPGVWQPIYNDPQDFGAFQWGNPGEVSHPLGQLLQQYGSIPRDLVYDAQTQAWQGPDVQNWTPEFNAFNNAWQPIGPAEQQHGAINTLLQNAGNVGYDPTWAGLDWAAGTVGQAAGSAMQLRGVMPYNLDFDPATRTWTHGENWQPQYLQMQNSNYDYSPFFEGGGGPGGSQGGGPGIATAGIDLANWLGRQFGAGVSQWATGLEGLTWDQGMQIWDATPDIQTWDATPGSNVNVIDAPLAGPTLQEIRNTIGDPTFAPDMPMIQNWTNLDWNAPGQVNYPMGLTMQSFGLLPLDVSWNPDRSAWDRPAVQNWTPQYAAPAQYDPWAGNPDWNTVNIMSGVGQANMNPIFAGMFHSAYPADFWSQSPAPQPQTWVQGGQMSIFGIPLAAGPVPSSIVQQIGPGGLPLAPGAAAWM